MTGQIKCPAFGYIICSSYSKLQIESVKPMQSGKKNKKNFCYLCFRPTSSVTNVNGFFLKYTHLQNSPHTYQCGNMRYSYTDGVVTVIRNKILENNMTTQLITVGVKNKINPDVSTMSCWDSISKPRASNDAHPGHESQRQMYNRHA